MKTLIEILNGVSGSWWTHMFHATWQAGLIGCVLLFAVFVGRRWPAPIRYGLLLVALLKFAFPPMLPVPSGVFSTVGPALTLPVANRSIPFVHDAPNTVSPVSRSEEFVLPQVEFRAGAGRLDHSTGVAGRFAPEKRLEHLPALRFESWLMLVHLSGTVLVLLWIAAQVIQLRGITRRASLVGNGWLYDQFISVSRQLDLRSAPRLTISVEAQAPMAFGVFRPTVMLPASMMQKLQAADIRTILAHELAHCRRRDLWINWLQLILLAVWWFNPVLWLLDRAIRKVREDCCDDLVLARALTSNDAYCDVLLRAATEFSGLARATAALGFADQLHPLGHRVARIMDRTIRRCPKMPMLGIFPVIILGALVLPGLRSKEADPGRAKIQGPDSTNSNSNAAAKTETPAASKADSFQEQFAKLRWFNEDVLELSPGEKSYRWEALKALGIISQTNSAAFPLIARALTDPETSIREEAAKIFLQSARNPDAAKLLEEALQQGELSERAYVAAALARAGRSSPEVLSVLLQSLDDGKIEVSPLLSVLANLGSFGDQAKPAIPALTKLADHENSQLRFLAIGALGQVGLGQPEVAEWLRKHLKDANPMVRSATINALQSLRSEGVAAGPAALQMLDDSDALVRRSAAQALAPLRVDPKQGVPALLRLLNDPDKFVASSALHGLGEYGAAAQEAVPAIVEKLEKSDWAAAAALGKIGPVAKPAVPALTKALESKEAGLRGNSAGALGKIGPGAGAAIPALERAMNDSDAGVRRNAAFSLWQIDGRTNVVGILIERLKSEENLNVLERLNATSTRLFDIGQLGEIGPQAEAALPLLREIVKGDDERIRATAQRALEKISIAAEP